MPVQLIVGVLLTITALAGFINYKFLKMPNSIGLTLVTLVISLGLMILGKFGLELDIKLASLLQEINFKRTVMEFMLSFLLFAGSLHVNVAHMFKFRWVIAQLATIGVLISTLLIGCIVYSICTVFSLDIPLPLCFLFGALISPTDPIAALGVLKRIDAPRSLELKIAGEALFNDGVGIVLFLTILNILGGSNLDFYHMSLAFFQEVLGGIFVGVALGRIAKFFIKRVGSFDVVLSITLAVVTGGYALANDVLHVSGAISMAIAGLIIGNASRQGKMPPQISMQLSEFWECIDELLNAILFVLIGFVVLFTIYDAQLIIVAALVIPGVLFARYLSVVLPILTLHRFKSFSHKTAAMMTWGGLRGGVSIALALTIPSAMYGRDIIVTMTYIVVIFSILVQGMTIGPLIKKLVLQENQ
jgi:CPA1 family monovalent cation:H+ antiporter